MLIEMPRGSSIHNGEKAARDESVVAPYLQEVQSVLNRSLRPGSYSSLASRLQPASNGTSASSSRKNRSGSRLLPAGYRDGLNGHVEVPEIDTLDVALKYDVAVQSRSIAVVNFSSLCRNYILTLGHTMYLSLWQ
ncbi:hypothetical protein RvY_18823 [Ramazzottius varieornatus]|uniref:Uncharacterized protein n=1 Tax=Ramazzottius varieornatus TaxID=947166 RepID=A0A1D1W772_RAMVA|nr:hypothetical protein RvY_18823 [Ramazzottius varieornatus]